MQKPRLFVSVLIVFAFALLPAQGIPKNFTPGFAQEEIALSESYTSFSGAMTLRYPAGWAVREDHEQIFLATDAALNFYDSPPPQDDQMRLLITPVPARQLGDNINAPAGLEFFLNNVVPDSREQYTAPQNLTVNSAPAVLVTGAEAASGMLILVIEAADGYLIFIVGASSADRVSALHDTALAVAESLTYQPPEIIWGIQRPVGGAESDFPPFTGIGVGSDDTIYVAAGTSIIEVSPEGEVLRTISPPQGSIPQNFADVAPAGDGSLWVADSLNHQIHRMNMDGDILSSFGDFGDLSPTQIQLYDGELYIFNSATNENGANVGEIQVWSTDGELLRRFPLANEGFAFGVKIALDADGNLYAADRVGGVRVFDAKSGQVVTGIFAQNDLAQVEVLAAAAHEAFVYVAAADGMIYQFDKDGAFLQTYGTAQRPGDDGQYGEFAEGEFFEPLGLVILSDGSLVIADTNQRYGQIVRFDF